jgi:hypothetical protein
MQEGRAAVAIDTKTSVRGPSFGPLLQDEPERRRVAALISEAKGRYASWT